MSHVDNKGRPTRYDYYACYACGQRVAHDQGGEVLHAHRRSKKCAKAAAARKAGKS